MDQRLKALRDWLYEIDHSVEPSFKDSKTYIGKTWRKATGCQVYPVQRRLTPHECVFDFDGISASQMRCITEWMFISKFKYDAWMSSPNGLHVHFYTDVTGLDRKKILVEVMSEKVKELFNVENDIGPMSQGMIRTEWAPHPRKKFMKIPFRRNMNSLFPMNDISAKVRTKVFDLGITTSNERVSNSGLDHGRCRTCMKTILDGSFSDCTKRLMFCVASHYVSVHGKENRKQAVKDTWAWCKRQKSNSVTSGSVWASVHSTKGTIGCNYRHELLEELGIDTEGCRWEDK